MPVTAPGHHLHQLSRLAAALRHLVRAAWAADTTLAASIDADVSRMESEIAALADSIMLANATSSVKRVRCHCGVSIDSLSASGRRRYRDMETCGRPSCVATAREVKRLLKRRPA